MRDFGSKRSATSGRDEQATSAGPGPGKRTLTEMLPATSSPVQRKADVAPAMPTGPQPSIADLFGQRAERQPSADSEPDAASRPTIFELFGAGVQRKTTGADPDTEQVHASAKRGTETPITSLPYAEQIQLSFGRHDISGIKANTGGEAAASAREIGAQAYATGEHVVLGTGVDLRTVAHEAAHVVQQRAGVHLKGGIGEESDTYERHADHVADLVVQGRSAESALDAYAPAGATRSGNAMHVQRKMVRVAEDTTREANEAVARMVAARTPPKPGETRPNDPAVPIYYHDKEGPQFVYQFIGDQPIGTTDDAGMVPVFRRALNQQWKPPTGDRKNARWDGNHLAYCLPNGAKVSPQESELMRLLNETPQPVGDIRQLADAYLRTLQSDLAGSQATSTGMPNSFAEVQRSRIRVISELLESLANGTYAEGYTAARSSGTAAEPWDANTSFFQYIPTEDKLEPVAAGKKASVRPKAQPYRPADSQELERQAKRQAHGEVLSREADRNPGDGIRALNLKVNSVSIRNFQDGENEEFVLRNGKKISTGGRTFIGVLDIPKGEIILTAVVQRDGDVDAPSNYEPTNMINGQLTRPLQDVRGLSAEEKRARRDAAPREWETGVFARAYHGLSENRLHKGKENSKMDVGITLPASLEQQEKMIPHRAPKPSSGSAHNQARMLSIPQPSDAIGFAVTKVNAKNAIFAGKSGTLNDPQFAGKVLYAPVNWMQVIMETISRDLGVTLVSKESPPEYEGRIPEARPPAESNDDGEHDWDPERWNQAREAGPHHEPIRTRSTIQGEDETEHDYWVRIAQAGDRARAISWSMEQESERMQSYGPQTYKGTGASGLENIGKELEEGAQIKILETDRIETVLQTKITIEQTGREGLLGQGQRGQFKRTAFKSGDNETGEQHQRYYSDKERTWTYVVDETVDSEGRTVKGTSPIIKDMSGLQVGDLVKSLITAGGIAKNNVYKVRVLNKVDMQKGGRGCVIYDPTDKDVNLFLPYKQKGGQPAYEKQ